VQVAGDGRDLSVFIPLVEAAGDWEPHVRAVLERLVLPDWVCIDVGANIGLHTLTLATLASSGQVFAFEAGGDTFAHLQCNAAELPSPKALITVEQRALWDETRTIAFAESDEFPGCAFVDEEADVSDTTSRTRSAHYPTGAVVTMTTHLREVAALRLDEWAAAHSIDRVDLIKLDVEGAEARVLAGAGETLGRFRPLLVTEYNPVCASEWFGATPDGYFRLLQRLYGAVQIIEPDGALSAPLRDWHALNRRLERGKGWEDLLCTPRPPRGLRRLLGNLGTRVSMGR
jgi:FkbM family methyltransferase